jgi:F-type H+-transporting ATPase subunit a
MKKLRTPLIIVGAIAAVVAGNVLLPVPLAGIEIAAEPIGLGPITNAILTSFILSGFILLAALIIGRRLKPQPGAVQNAVEAVIEALGKFVSETAPAKWGPRFFPICVTIFLFLLVANVFGLLAPLLGSFGIVHVAEHGTLAASDLIFLRGTADTVLEHARVAVDHEPRFSIVPLLRAPTSDLNLTLALALTTMVLVQFFGFWSRGAGYLGHFFRFRSLRTKGIGMGLADMFVGFIDLISEISKVITFSFRLFGNIFAGEVILIVISSLASLLLVLAFFGLELFVGLIQAFVFFILALSFFSLAVTHAEDH